MVTDINELDFNKLYTYSDYLTWKFSERVELIKGKIFRMAAPSRVHQRISWNLSLSLGNHLKSGKCEAFSAPFDVRLPLLSHQIKGNKASTVVQPDICVVCDLSKLDDRGCNGAPDLVVEILSPSNSTKEVQEKFDLYQNAGVAEYWVVQPSEAFIIRYNLNENGEYIGSRIFTTGDTMASKVLVGFEVELDQIFVK
jgi:Uma2 family endonuclease